MTIADLLTILVVALAVYVPKALPLLLIGDRTLQPIRRWLELIAPAVLAALVAPSILISDHALTQPRPLHLVFAATFIAAIVSRRMLPSLAVGGIALLLVVLATGENS